MTPKSGKRGDHIGLPPGSLVYLGERKTDTAIIDVIDYNEAGYEQHRVESAQACQKYIKRDTVTWINVTGLHDTALLEAFGQIFEIHPLVLEDILTVSQRPKMEDLDKHLFFSLKMLYPSATTGWIMVEHVSLVLGPDYVLSFQEQEGDVFGAIRDRISAAKGRIRKMGCDYLAYSLLDAVVDHYFVVLEDLGDRIEALQDKVVGHPEPRTLQEINHLRREMIMLRKNLWPLRELVSRLEKCESRLIKKSTLPYLRDVYEHTIQVIDTVETLRDTLTGALDIYMTTVSNRMNEVMKVLTIIATIFIPLTFIAGIYGMNFDPEASAWNMPELRCPYGYAATWGVMLVVALLMVWYFKRKRWF